MRYSSLIILLVASLASTLFAQDCNNPLLAILDLPALPAPETGTGLQFCPNLQNGQTCCAADTVNGFQGRLDGLVENLNNYDAARDLYLAQLNERFFDRFQDLVDDVTDIFADKLQAIRNFDANLATLLQADIDNFNAINIDANNIDNRFSEALDDFQDARNNCYTAALQVQASSWCLACDPNYATGGVNSDGTVTFADDLCQSLNDACWPYFNQASRFNPLIRARQAYWRLLKLEAYLNDISATGIVVAFNNVTQNPDPWTPLESQQPVIIPNRWIAGNANTPTDEQCSNFWAGDHWLAQLLTIGRSMPIETEFETEFAMFEEEMTLTAPSIQVTVTVNSGTRLLQDSLAETSGTWAPMLSATGLDFSDLLSDPGDYFGVSDYSDYLRSDL